MKFFSLVWWDAFANTNRKKISIILLLVFGICFSLISLVNHYFFRTYAFDLGIFNNALYDYAHFRWNDNPVKLYQNILSDHFTLLHIPFSLFSWIFGTYTLLIIQIAAVLFGAYGAYKYHLMRSQGNNLLASILLFHFLSIWGIYSALAFDYHDNVVAAMLVPWFFYYFHQKKWAPTILFYALILCSKENMALWAIFLNLGLALKYFRDRSQLRYALMFSFIAAVYFVVVVKLIIPNLAAGERPYTYILNYAALGNNFSDILGTLLTKPFYTIGLLFKNHLGDPYGDGIKAELHMMVFLAGGLALLLRPAYLLMLVPIYAQKLFISNFVIWGINAQYSIEFVPILNIALVEFLIDQPRKRAAIIAFIVLFTTLGSTLWSFTNRVSKWHDRAATIFYQKRHYKQTFNVHTAHEALKLIPENASVSALSPLVPHLAFRDYIFEFPFIGNAEYLALIEGGKPYPLTEENYRKTIKQLRNSADWKVFFDQDSVLILKRTTPLKPNETVNFQ